MIVNRTYRDVVEGRRIYQQKVQKFLPVTAEEKAILDRAFFNLSALNRITERIKTLWVLIEAKGGTRFNEDDVRTWEAYEVFKLQNFKNIIANIQKLVNQMMFLNIGKDGIAETVLNQASRINEKYDWNNLNRIESVLENLIYTAQEEPQWVMQIGNRLNVSGAFGASVSGEELRLT